MNKEKGKITIISLTTTYPESKNSIRPSFVHVLNKEFVRRDVEILVLTPHAKNSLKVETIDDVKIKRFQYLPQNWQINSLSLPNAIKSKSGFFKAMILIVMFFFHTFSLSLKVRPDVIHAQWAFPSGVIAQIVSSIFGSKSIISCHGAEIPLLKKFKLIRKVTAFSLNRSSFVTAVSNYTKRELINLGIKENKIIRINATPNFVNHINDLKKLEDFRKSITDSENKIILFLGRLVERKGVKYLIEAVPKMKFKNYHVVIAGDGILLENLRNIVNSLKIKNQVTFFVAPSQDERALLYQVSDIFVCPSVIDSTGETEAIPTVIPEAMEVGMPIIGSSVGGIPDVIEHEKNGLLVSQKNSTSIASAIDRILMDGQLRKNLIENSKSTVKEFSAKEIVTEFLKIFRS